MTIYNTDANLPVNPPDEPNNRDARQEMTERLSRLIITFDIDTDNNNNGAAIVQKMDKKHDVIIFSEFAMGADEIYNLISDYVGDKKMYSNSYYDFEPDQRHIDNGVSVQMMGNELLDMLDLPKGFDHVTQIVEKLEIEIQETQDEYGRID